MVTRLGTSIGEETFNAISHGVGAVAAIIGFLFLMVHAEQPWQTIRFWGLFIFGTTSIILYVTSTVFHSLTFTKAYGLLKKLDYTAISLFIAGSYTPIALVTLRNNSGLLLLIVVWTLTLFGIIWRLFGIHKDTVLLILYLLTGWLVMVYIVPLSHLLPLPSLIALLIGGISYTVGTIFFSWRRLAYNHGIWHICVLFGSLCHFYTMMHI